MRQPVVSHTIMGVLMRISSLSRRSGTPLGTIKFYLRERLLPPGRPTGRNQAEYDETHLQRLHLIRALTTVAGMDLSSVRQLLGAVADEELPLPRLYEVLENVVGAGDRSADSGSAEAARADVDTIVERMGWSLRPDMQSRHWLVQVLAALKDLGCVREVDVFLPYALAADEIAVHQLDMVPPDCTGSQRTAAIVRSIMLGVALTAMHQMAQEHHARQRFSPTAQRG